MTYFLKTASLAAALGLSAGPAIAQQVNSADADHPGEVVERAMSLTVASSAIDDSDTPGVRLQRPPVEITARIDDSDLASMSPSARRAVPEQAVFTDAQLGRVGDRPVLASLAEPDAPVGDLSDGRSDQLVFAHTVEVYDGPLDDGRTPAPEEGPQLTEVTAPATAESRIEVADLVIDGVAPNPVRDRATITFQAPVAGHAVVTVYDVRGREVGVAFDGAVADGAVERVVLDLSQVATGTYVVVVDMAGQRTSRTFQVVR